MKSLIPLAFISSVVGEKWWLHKAPKLPGPKTLEVVHFFTLYQDQTPTISFAGEITFDREIKSTGVQLSVIHSTNFEKIDSTHFCCSTDDIAEKKCRNIDTLILTNPAPDGNKKIHIDSFSWKISTEPNSVTAKIEGEPALVKQSGLYFVALSNCDVKDESNTKILTGELEAKSAYGYLPGEEFYKLSFYGWLSVAYTALGLVWLILCVMWKDVLFTIHHFMSITIFIGLCEALSWYVSLYHWNFVGHRWHSMIALAIAGTTIKQGVSYMLLLGGCLGWGVTKPSLDRKCLAQVIFVVLAFIGTDSFRQFHINNQNRTQGEQSTWWIIAVVAPGSFFVSLIYVWILQALNDTIKELTETNQTVKADVYQSLRLALGVVVGCVLLLVGYETIVVRRTDLSYNWQNRWFFTDFGSHCIFFGLLTVMMYLWKPNERSLEYAYSIQLDSKGGVTMGNPVDDADGVDNFNSVDVEIGDGDDDDFSFKKSMQDDEITKDINKKKKLPEVLE